jgi:hypothetical protein
MLIVVHGRRRRREKINEGLRAAGSRGARRLKPLSAEMFSLFTRYAEGNRNGIRRRRPGPL